MVSGIWFLLSTDAEGTDDSSLRSVFRSVASARACESIQLFPSRSWRLDECAGFDSRLCGLFPTCRRSKQRFIHDREFRAGARQTRSNSVPSCLPVTHPVTFDAAVQAAPEHFAGTLGHNEPTVINSGKTGNRCCSKVLHHPNVAILAPAQYCQMSAIPRRNANRFFRGASTWVPQHTRIALQVDMEQR